MDINKEDLEAIIGGLGVTKSSIDDVLGKIKALTEKSKDQMPEDVKKSLEYLDSKVFSEFDKIKKDIEKVTGA